MSCSDTQSRLSGSFQHNRCHHYYVCHLHRNLFPKFSYADLFLPRCTIIVAILELFTAMLHVLERNLNRHPFRGIGLSQQHHYLY